MPAKGQKKVVEESALSAESAVNGAGEALAKPAKAPVKRVTKPRAPRGAAAAAAAEASGTDKAAPVPSLPFEGEASKPAARTESTVRPTPTPAAPVAPAPVTPAPVAAAPAPVATQQAPAEPKPAQAVPQQGQASGYQGGFAQGHENTGFVRPARFEERDARSDVRAAEGRSAEIGGRGVESRGLRFRGRDGRAEVRTGGNRNDTRGFRPRQEHRDGGEGGNNFNARMQQRDQGGRDNYVQNRPDQVRHNQPPRDNEVMALEDKNINELRVIAGDLGIMTTPQMKKQDVVLRILEAQSDTSANILKTGILEILPDGKGFLRTEGYLPSNEDVYVSQSQIKRFSLRTGDMVTGQVRAPKEMERYYGLLRVESTNEESPDLARTRKEFEKLTPIFPDEKFKLETTQENITARIIDLVSPIGKGQRGLIVAPPKAGKTTLIKNIANSIMANHPEVHLIVLLIDERPEEVTDISRSVRGEVVASTFDEMPDNHVRVADMVLEKAKRMVEQKKDVVILLDSLTRLSRASNLVVAPSGRTMSGGLDPAAMHKPKRLFGAARNIEEGGSLTILATALVDTGSRMDDYIFEEFKGTGNLDLVLDRSLFDQRIFPAIDINRSGTRRDDLLLSKDDLATVFHLRRTLASLDNDKAITLLIDRLKNTKSNEDFMAVVQKSARQTTTQ